MEITVIRDDGSESSVEIMDKDIVRFVEDNWDTLDEDLPAVLKIGVTALKASQTAVDTNYVDKEFMVLRADMEKQLEDFQKQWEKDVRAAFGDDFSKMRDSMDPDDPETPTGKMLEHLEERMKEMMGDMNLDDPETPMGRFKQEIEHKFLAILTEVSKKKGAEEEESKGTAKGTKYEDELEPALNAVVAPFHDNVYGTGSDPGTAGSKKGDFVSELDGGAGRKVVFEVKRKKISLSSKFYKDEIVEAMNNRGAQSAVLVMHPEHADILGRPLRIWKGDCVACVYDPETGDKTALEVAYQLARHIALAKDQFSSTIDLGEFKEQLDFIYGRIEQITSIEKAMAKSIKSLDDSKKTLNALKIEILGDVKALLDSVGSEDEE